MEKWGTGLSCSPSQNTVLSKQPCFQCVMLDGDQLYRRSNSSYMLHFLTMPPTFCNITLSLTFNRQFVTMLCLMYGRQVNQVEKATRFDECVTYVTFPKSESSGQAQCRRHAGSARHTAGRCQLKSGRRNRVHFPDVDWQPIVANSVVVRVQRNSAYQQWRGGVAHPA